MTLDTSSPLWAVLADWVKVILTLPDPPPDSLVQLNDVAILAAISALTERMFSRRTTTGSFPWSAQTPNRR